MRTKLRAAFFVISLFLTTSIVHAQSQNTKHVFPQIVDGIQSDGSAFTSRIWIASIGGFPASCSLSIYGFGPERLTSSASIVVQPSSFVTISTRGQDAVADGVRSSGLHATGLCVAYLILANGSVGSDNFNVTGLLFDGGTFTTLVPATID